MSGAYKGVALFVWSRHRPLIITCCLLYLALLAGSIILSAAQARPYLLPAYSFLRAAPFFLPLLLFVSGASVATMDLASAESRFPRQFFALPLSTNQIVFPFMLGALLTCALLWSMALWISGGRVLYAGPLDAPLAVLSKQTWFLFLQLSLLVWAQALIWMSFRRSWMRVVALLGLVFIHAVALVLAASGRVSSNSTLALCLIQLPLAYSIAVWGVSRARHGEPAQSVARQIKSKSAPRQAKPFTSGFSAQAWFEQRVHRARGKTLAFVFIAPILLLTVVASLSIASEYLQAETSLLLPIVTNMLFGALGIVGVASGPAFASFQSNVDWYKNAAFTMPSFFATLPLSTGDFAWAKMKTAARSMAWQCGIVLLAAVAIVALTNVQHSWLVLFSGLSERYGVFEAGALLGVLLLAFALLTLAGTANLVWVALIGRGWRFVNAAACVIIVGAVLLPAWTGRHPERFVQAATVLPNVLPFLAAAKLSALALLIHRVGSRQLYPWPRIAWIAGLWLAAIAAGLALYWRFVPDGIVNTTTVLFGLIVLLPVLGIMAAPMALHWNRCR